MKKKISITLVILFVICSCVSDKNNIENRKWFLIDIEGDADLVILNQKEPYIEFDLESSKIGGNATCNNFFASYSIEGDSIGFGRIATTMMSCSDPTNQEYRFLKALDRIETFKISDNTLYLYEGETPILTFTSKLKN